MFCPQCGNPVREGAKFCSKCGKKLVKDSAPDAEEKARQSLQILQNVQGYYCYGCGNYVSSRDRGQGCPYCGVDRISSNAIASGIADVLDYGLIGSAIVNIHSSLQKTDARSAYSHIVDYYKSEYYRKTQFPFETVAQDKGLMGEYLVDIQYQRLKKSYPGRKFHILYNLFIPEPNGSFEEIDAVIIYGRLVFVIEAKNRSGSFEMNHISDDKWTQTLGNSRQEIVSPVMQNEWHIDALEHFISSKGIRIPAFYNYVSLAGGASFHVKSNVDAYDDAILRTWYICNTPILCDGLVKAIQQVDKVYENLAELMHNTVADQLRDAEEGAQELIGALRGQIRMDNSEKDLYMRDREETSRNRRRFPYQYYYVKPACCLIGSVVRWNREYLQVINNFHTDWASDSDWHITPQGLPQFQNADGDVYVLDSPIKIVNAVQCAKSCTPYEDAQGKRYYEQAHHEERREESHEEQREQHHEEHHEEYHEEQHENQSAQGNGLVYFSGCDSLEKVEKRYKMLARAFHPDVGSGDEESFKKMQREYEQVKIVFS